jgi:hypothetical protein
VAHARKRQISKFRAASPRYAPDSSALHQQVKDSTGEAVDNGDRIIDSPTLNAIHERPSVDNSAGSCESAKNHLALQPLSIQDSLNEGCGAARLETAS